MLERYSDWDKWKKTISQAVSIGDKLGLEDETIIGIGSKFGDFLDNNIDPKNKEQRVIKELWDVASEDEQTSLTSMIIKMVKKDNQEGDQKE